MEVLSLRNITKSFTQPHEKIEVLRNINLSVKAAEIIALLGPSGSGKTTLLYIAGLLSNPDSGEVIINNNPYAKKSEKIKTSARLNNIGFVYQSSNLLSDFSAIENIMLPLYLQNIDEDTAQIKAEKILSKLDLISRKNCYPNKLSGGEQQRIAIARSLIHNPKIILADEPTGNLDSLNAFKVMDLFINMAKEKNTAILIVTHDNKIASKCDRVIQLKNGVIHE